MFYRSCVHHVINMRAILLLFAVSTLICGNPPKDDCLRYTCKQLAFNGANLSTHECHDSYTRCVSLNNLLGVLVRRNKSNESTVAGTKQTNASAFASLLRKILANFTIDQPKLSERPYDMKYILTTEDADPNHGNVDSINNTFFTLFSKVRNHEYDPKYKEFVQRAVINTFVSYGLEAEEQNFEMSSWSGSYTAKNLIGILPSVHYGKKGDRTFVIGGHYDTVYGNPGVDDNGSGSVLVMEAARVLSKYKGKLNATIYFVLFDQEETGLHGSAAFVKSYYIPNVLDRFDAVHKGAYITDMVLLYDPAPNSQVVSKDMETMTPEATAWIKQNSYRGDFISVMSRKGIDTELWTSFKDAWEESNSSEYKILAMDAPIPAEPSGISLTQSSSDFTRSDHVSFWSSSRYHRHVKTLSAVLLWDLGPWRGYQRNCYHKPCDNIVQLTPENLMFMTKITNTVISSTLKIANKIHPI